MGFLKQHIEKVLFLVLAVLLGVSILLTLARQSGFTGVESVRAGTGEVDIGLNFEKYDNILKRLTEQPHTVELSRNTFTPEVRVRCINPDDRALIPPEVTHCPYCGWDQTERGPDDVLGDGVPDDEKRRLGLPLDDPNAIHQVLDGSGFTVLQQYSRGHDAADPSDYPPHIEFLRLEDIEERSVTFELRGTAQPAAGVYMLQLRWRYPDADRWDSGYVRTGNTFGRNDEFTAVSFTEDRVFEDDRFQDRSFALIRSGRHEVRLNRDGEGRTGRISERSAGLHLYIGPDWSKRVRVDQSLILDNKTYMVVDIHADSVVIREEEADETITIRRATLDEIEEAEPPEPEREGATPIDDDELGFDPRMIWE